MLRAQSHILGGLFAFLLLASATLHAQTVTVMANESMPFQGMIDGKPAGITVDLLQEITRHGGPAFDLQIGIPQQRALYKLSKAKERPVIYVSLTRLPQREDDYTWITPLFNHQVRVISYQQPAPQSIDAAKDLSTGIIIGSGAIPLAEEMGFTQLQQVVTATQNTQKLRFNRLDTIIESDIVNAYYWSKLGYDPDELNMGLRIGDIMQTYIAGNPTFPPDLADNIHQAMQRVKQSGRYTAILNKWTRPSDMSALSTSSYNTTFITHSIEGKTVVDELGELRGLEHLGRRAFNIELVREMMLQMHHPVAFKVAPLKRGQYELSKNKTALFNLAKTKEREPLYKWVGPLQVDQVYFYQANNNPATVHTLDDAKSADGICVMRGTSQYDNLKKLGFNNLRENNKWANCLRMLTTGRVALVPISDSLLNAMIKQAQVNKEDIKSTRVLAQVNAGYIAFSKDHPDEVIDKWQRALDGIKASGRYDELMDNYMWPLKE